ncbi:methyltransferase [Mycobacteroides abscessus subsp. bolletii]|uniref:class I SAM-dependent methyltransferase n=1 Tax=Mycobacteroides abscessus TaxID=36809 RepID=UPI000928F435|nr:class I SAM-dependent methyltransferase [Mycobacteroides abscessus]SIJ33004.1 methyltransferase [Mycobacteroides abscessus subsp. bolletii]
MTEPDFLRLTREGYDRTAKAYANQFHQHLDSKPVDRAILAAFVGLVATTENIRVADIGCGTGAATALLDHFGAQPFGIDLSPNMIQQARILSPTLDFMTGSMTKLDIPDTSVGGICAWYSIIHIPDDHLPKVFAEFHRVLTPGGWLLLAFQAGNQPRILTEAFGEPVDLIFRRRVPGAVESLLSAADLHMYARLIREPDDDGFESTPHAYLIAQKPK